MRSFILFFLLLIVLNHSTSAEDSRGQLIVQWDNDLLTGTDDGYTNGVRIALAREIPIDSSQHNFLQHTLRSFSGARRDGFLGELQFPEARAQRFQYGIGLSQLMFTPKDPDTRIPARGERPYAAWLGLEFSLQASATRSASTATLSIGTTGSLAYGEDIQDWVHQNISHSPLFDGWDSQAPGELTLNLHLDHKRRFHFSEATRDWPVELDGFSEWGAAVGNFQTNVYLGAFLRAGHNLPQSSATPRVQLGSFTKTVFENGAVARKNFSFYGFAGVRAYAVLHDISLDGPVFHDWNEAADSEPLVGEFSLGFAGRWKNSEISLAHIIRTDEFEHQRNRSRYGSVMLRLKTHF